MHTLTIFLQRYYRVSPFCQKLKIGSSSFQKVQKLENAKEFPCFKWHKPRKLFLREVQNCKKMVQNSDTRGTTISNDLNMAKWGHPTVLEQNWATKKLFLSLEDEGFTVWLWRFSFFLSCLCNAMHNHTGRIIDAKVCRQTF